MNRWGRVAIGALVGAILTLFLHPGSARFLRTAFVETGPSIRLSDSEWIPDNLGILPIPENTLQASLWMQSGAERLAEGKKIEPADLERLVQVAEGSARGEPQNAFWLQMDAVFLWELGRKEQARQRWEHASRASSYNDYQSRRLDRLMRELEAYDGGPMAWHAAAAYYRRSTATARTVEWLCRGLFERDIRRSADELALRLATVRNGRLLRDGSRSIAVGVYGAEMVEFSCAPVGVPRSSPREQILSRYALVNALREAGLRQEATETDGAFQSNDAWLALTRPTRAIESAGTLAGIALSTAVVAGVCLGLSLLGLGVFGLASLMEAHPKLQRFLSPPWTPGIGLLLGVCLYVQTGLILAAAAVTLCFAFVAFEPTTPRKSPPHRMRFGFRFAVIVLAVCFILLLGGFWAGLTAPAYEIVGHLPIHVDLFGGNTILPSLAVLVFSMLFLAAPGWAIVDRISTPFAIVQTLREFGRRVFWIGFLASLAAAPAAVYVDNQVRSTLHALVANEPAHYLLQ